MKCVRLPYAPLAAECVDQTCLSELIGVPRRTLYRWSVDGGVPFTHAEQIATKLRTHPAEIWHDDWWKASVDA